MRNLRRSRKGLRGPRSKTRVAEVRVRRMTPEEEVNFAAALDALVLLVAGRVVGDARGGDAGPSGAGGRGIGS